MRSVITRLKLHFTGRRDALALALLGIAIGLFSGIVTVAFRVTIESGERLIASPEGYRAASDTVRFFAPVAGVALTVAFLYFIARGAVATGVVHVLERLARGEGRLPVRNAIVQFVAASLLLMFGVSMGREGPAIHIGAASGSILGQALRIPERSLHTLAGCGVAAAIGATFNTPLAGVILAMEVVLMEYTTDGFTPVLLAGVTGAVLGRLFYGDAPAFAVPQLALVSLWELPYIAVMGLAIGGYAALFILWARTLLRATRSVPWWLGMSAAGILVGACGYLVPQVLGVGYEVIGDTLAGKYVFGTLAAIVVMKLLATGIAAGARLPGGLIGPTLVMGVAAGGVFGAIGTAVVPDNTSSVTLYAMLGMGAMMGATLQAPLAALLAVLELTGNPYLVLPGILAIVTASLSAKELFGCESIFFMQAREQDFDPLLARGNGDRRLQ
ncbi:MAG: chloride channel protein [Methanocella sp.]